MELHQNKMDLHNEENNQTKRQPAEREKIFANDITVMLCIRLVFKICKELVQINTKTPK